MTPQLIDSFSSFGLSGVVIGILFYIVFYMGRKLINVIENNTEAMSNMKETLRNSTEEMIRLNNIVSNCPANINVRQER